MKELFTRMRSRSISSIAIILTLTALCFSVGEGLRLTPFPLQAGSSFSEASQSSVHKYGPLDVPVQSQKRSKRFAVDLSGPISLYTYELSTRRPHSSEYQSTTVASNLLVAFPLDRGPPSTV